MTLAEVGYRIEAGLPAWLTPVRSLMFICVAMWMLGLGL